MERNFVYFLTVDSLKKAQEDAASLTPEFVAANMSKEEAARLSRVRNIGIAVWAPNTIHIDLESKN